MPIIKRRLDICGREKEWEYLVESGGTMHRVTVRQVGQGELSFQCSCGACATLSRLDGTTAMDYESIPCLHIFEAKRDLSIARQATAQMTY